VSDSFNPPNVERPNPVQYAYAIAPYELNRNTDFTEKFCVRVDMTGEFPFLVPYYDP
jgi:hypothetical protein